MLIKPDYNLLVERIGSKYRLCVVAAKRAAQLVDNAVQAREGKAPRYRAAMVDFVGKTPLHIALEEIASGYIVAAEPMHVEEVQEAQEVEEAPVEVLPEEAASIFEELEELTHDIELPEDEEGADASRNES